MKIETVTALSDAALDAELKRLAACEREVTVALVLHLAELDARRLYLGHGFPSLFKYCRVALSLSEHGAYHRIVAARAAKRHPSIAGMLAHGSLNLSTLRLLAPHLTHENAPELLGLAHGGSKRAVEELVAARFPQPARPSSIRKVPVRARVEPAPEPAPASATLASPSSTGAGATDTSTADTSTADTSTTDMSTTDMSATGVDGTVTGPRHGSGPSLVDSPATKPQKPIAPPLPSRPARMAPCAEDEFDFRFRGTRRLRDEIDAARDLLRHAIPDGDLGEIVERAVIEFVADLRRKKFAATSGPRAGRGTAPGSRTISAAVERLVWARDEGRCAFVAESGRRCDATALLEFHHLEPYGVGGPPTVENIQLRCRAHNQYEAELFYKRDVDYDRWYREADPAV